jgi:hypothetical protein
VACQQGCKYTIIVRSWRESRVTRRGHEQSRLCLEVKCERCGDVTEACEEWE